MKNWKRLGCRTVLEHPPFLRVEMHDVEFPGGQVVRDWSWVVTPDYVNVVAQREDGQFLIFRQQKYAVEGESLAPVGGFVEPGEDPRAAARRELLEETGYEAARWDALGDYVVDPNRGPARAYFFLARQAKPVAAASGGDLETQELLLLNRSEVEAALAEGRFKVLGWAASVTMALKHLG